MTSAKEMVKILGTSSDYLKYGFIRRSYVSDDKMYEFEYRDLASNETNPKDNINKINEYIDFMKKYKKYERVNYLQILEDFAEYLYCDSMTDAYKVVPEEFDDIVDLISLDEFKETLKKNRTRKFLVLFNMTLRLFSLLSIIKYSKIKTNIYFFISL